MIIENIHQIFFGIQTFWIPLNSKVQIHDDRFNEPSLVVCCQLAWL